MQPTRQAKCYKWRCGVSTIAPLAAPSLDVAAVDSCKVSRLNASKLAGCRGDAMVARRDALMAGQGDNDNIYEVPSGRHSRCIQLWLGGWWRPPLKA